ncbi:MAG: sugar phosphate isomerase/epimerase family protein [bacterium]
MRIGFVTDEISPDLEEALRIGISWGVYDYELRMIGEKRIPDIPEAQIEKIFKMKKEFGIRITALSPGSFKCRVNDRTQVKRELAVTLPETLRLAQILGAQIVLVFGFFKPKRPSFDQENKVVDIFRKVAGLAAQHNLIVAVENEPGFCCDSGENTARILRKVDSPYLRANWDPANAVGAGAPAFPQGYDSIKPWIANVHIKDTVQTTAIECVPVGEGIVDWCGQLQALARDKTVEHVTIETHCLPLLEKSQQNLMTVREILKNVQIADHS